MASVKAESGIGLNQAKAMVQAILVVEEVSFEILTLPPL